MNNHTYTQELEHLILDTLLPVYERYQKSKGITNPLSGINTKILFQIKQKRKLPALLRDYGS